MIFQNINGRIIRYTYLRCAWYFNKYMHGLKKYCNILLIAPTKYVLECNYSLLTLLLSTFPHQTAPKSRHPQMTVNILGTLDCSIWCNQITSGIYFFWITGTLLKWDIKSHRYLSKFYTSFPGMQLTAACFTGSRGSWKQINKLKALFLAINVITNKYMNVLMSSYFMFVL